jgi:DNA-binding SARP family transcriptional activator
MAQARSALKSKSGGTLSPRTDEPSSSALNIRLLGGFELRDFGGATLSLTSRKAEALIALLAVRPGQLWSRDKICALLWPEVRDAQARHSLRQTLLSVRKVLPPSALKTHGRTLLLDPLVVEVDVAQLAANLAECSRDALERAAALYQGDLLEGLYVPEQPFEQWLTSERERLRSMTIHGLSRLVDLHAALGALGAAVETCLRLLQLDPLREAAHRVLMQLYLRQGRRSAALQQYHALVRLLDSELGAAPETDTERLFHALSQSSVVTVARISPATALGFSEPPSEAEVAARSGSELLDSSLPPCGFGTAGAIGLADDVSGHELAESGSAAPLVGRTAELAALADAFERAQKRRTRVALVLGEVGIGKTRLIEQFAADVAGRGARVLRTRCYESEQVLPFALWSNALRSTLHEDPALLRELPEHVRHELCQLLPALALPTAEEPPRTRDVLSLFQALRWLVGWLGRSAPLVLLLDDVHWCDDMSLRALCFLSRPDPPAGPCLFVVTAREEEVQNASPLSRTVLELEREDLLARIPLAPLSRADTALLTRRVAEAQDLSALRREWIERIWAISDGNPLVVVESARALAAGVIAQDVATLPVPERVRTLILNRFARLSTSARELLSLAAVIGRETRLDLLQRPDLDQSAQVAVFEELVAARFLRADDEQLYFTHDRIRETIYASLLPARRRLLHSGVACTLEALHQDQLDEVAGLIAYHHSKAGNAVKAVPLLIRFSERAWRLHGVGEALSALEQALADSARLPPSERVPTAIAIIIRQAACLSFYGRIEELLERLADYEPALLALDRPPLSGPFYFWWGLAEGLVGQQGVAKTRCERALSEATRCADRRMIGYAHALNSWLYTKRGAFDQGVEHGIMATELLSMDQDLPEAVVVAWLNLIMNYYLRGDWQDALSAIEHAHELACAADNKRGQALALAGIATVYAYIEDWQSSLACCVRAVEASQEPFTMVHALWVLGWAHTGSGRPDLALAALERSLAELDRHSMYAFMSIGWLRAAEAHLALGNPDSALENAQRALDTTRATQDMILSGVALRLVGRAELSRGQLDLARRHFAEALTLFEGCPAPIEVAHTLSCQAELAYASADHDAARTLFARARAGFATRDVPRAVLRLEQRTAELSLC